MTRAGIEPATYGLTYHFGFRRPWAWCTCAPRFVVWTVPLPSPHVRWSGTRRPVSTPSAEAAWLGVGSVSAAFPDFDGIHTRHFW